jgi:hypothetical protein
VQGVALSAWPHKPLGIAFGRLAVSASLFAELIDAPGRSEKFVNWFLEEGGIVVSGNCARACGALPTSVLFVRQFANNGGVLAAKVCGAKFVLQAPRLNFDV